MAIGAPPARENRFLAEHVVLILESLKHWTGRELVNSRHSDVEAAQQVFEAPFPVMSHDTAADPIFNYANRTTLNLFEMTWGEFIALPSRLSAEPVARAERDRLLAAVSAKGFVDDYSGARITKHDRRFLIEQATVWNLVDVDATYRGQAAVFEPWRWL
jgi:hypothetical protein